MIYRAYARCPRATVAGRLVKGRIIVRNLIENLFLARDLTREGAATLEKLSADQRASRLKRGKLIKEDAEFFAPDHIALLDVCMETLAKGRQLNPRSVAEDNSLSRLTFSARSYRRIALTLRLMRWSVT